MADKKIRQLVFLIFCFVSCAVLVVILTTEGETKVQSENKVVYAGIPFFNNVPALKSFFNRMVYFIRSNVINGKFIIGLLIFPAVYCSYKLIKYPCMKSQHNHSPYEYSAGGKISFSEGELQKYIEEKVKQRTRELELDNEARKREITKKRHSETGNLQLRLNHLNCLYGLSELMEQPQMSLHQVFEKAPDLIRQAYEHPEKMSIGINFDGIHYKSGNFEKSEISQYTDIKIDGRKAGGITVYYLGPEAHENKNIFTSEQSDLLHAVSARLASFADQKKGADRLKLFRYLIDQSNDCIFLIEPKWGRLLDVNDMACQTLGYTRDELLAMSIKAIEHSFSEETSWQRLLSKLEVEKDILTEGTYTRKDGSSFFVEISFNYIQQGKDEYLLALARDISERKEAERQQAELIGKLKQSNHEVEKVNQELKDFAYIVSHDLKAPLRGIKTLADWLSTDYADAFDEDGKKQMNLLLSRVGRMHDLIEGILQYSRAGQVYDESNWVDLTQLIPDVIDMLAPPDDMSITVECRLPTVYCDKTRISQVFQNLISNSIKYMNKKNGKIKVDCIEEEECWKFSIADNGPGIEKKHFDRIFRMFQTLTPKDEFESTGVGLTVTRKIVSLYGGEIWLESEVGKGTTFFFTLPKRQKEQINDKLASHTAC